MRFPQPAVAGAIDEDSSVCSSGLATGEGESSSTCVLSACWWSVLCLLAGGGAGVFLTLDFGVVREASTDLRRSGTLVGGSRWPPVWVSWRENLAREIGSFPSLRLWSSKR